MPKILRSQAGIAHILVLAILLVGLGAGTYLVQKTQVFKPKASEGDDCLRFTKISGEEARIKYYFCKNKELFGSQGLRTEPKAYQVVNINDHADKSAIGLNLPYQSVCDNKDPHRILSVGNTKYDDESVSVTCPDGFPLCKQFAPGAAGCVANISDERGYYTSVYDADYTPRCEIGSYGSINNSQAMCITEKMNKKVDASRLSVFNKLYFPPLLAERGTRGPEGNWCGANAWPAIVNHWLKKYATASEKQEFASCLSTRCPVPESGYVHTLGQDAECVQEYDKALYSWRGPVYDAQGKLIDGCRSTDVGKPCSDVGDSEECKQICSKPENALWIGATCDSKGKFSGCRLTKETGGYTLNYDPDCSNWGTEEFPNWSSEAFEQCKEACSMPKPDKFCIGKKSAPNTCPVTTSCCASSVDGDKTYFQTCGTTKSFDGKSRDTSCPKGYQWCYSGYCVNENYNLETKKCS